MTSEKIRETICAATSTERSIATCLFYRASWPGHCERNPHQVDAAGRKAPNNRARSTSTRPIGIAGEGCAAVSVADPRVSKYPGLCPATR
jgi:hypothetical protein